MIRRVIGFLYILLFVWAVMILGLWIINYFIVPFQPPGISMVVDGVLKVVISTVLVLVWLWTWRTIVSRIFWKAIRRQHLYINETKDKKQGDIEY